MEKNLIRKFSIYSILIIVILGIVLNLVISSKIENMVMERSQITTVSWVELHSTNLLTPVLFRNLDYNKNKENFERFYAMIKTDEIIRIKVYDDIGTIVFSDEGGLVGKNYQDNEPLKKALKGSVEVEINRKLEKSENAYERKNYSSLMEIYVPVRSSSGEVYGVIELYQILDIIDKEIFKLQMTIGIIIFLGLFTLYFSLIWIVKDASETILKQNLALIKSHQDIKEMDKMKNEFINAMSHELRTPLNAVIGFSDLMKQKNTGELNERQERYIDNILKSGKHLLAIVNDILDMIVIEAGKIELAISTFPVHLTIDENIERVRSNAEKNNIIINKEIDPQLEFIEADRQKFSQIFFNILDNALKFSKKDGGVVNIIARKTGDKAQFSVSDNGIGIKEENFGKLFKVFQQLDTGISRKYGGTGLGLSISKKLVELHGGKIWVESKYGEGTTFTFELPLVQKKEVKPND
jgi:signal transduction histidine kinase